MLEARVGNGFMARTKRLKIRRRLLIEDVLDMIRVIRAAYDRGFSELDLRQEAERLVAAREVARRRFKSQYSARKSIHDACTRRLRLTAVQFDSRVVAWLSANAEELHSVLRKVDGYGANREVVKSLLCALPRLTTNSARSPKAFPVRGTPDVASRFEVQRAAKRCVAEHFRERGYAVPSVEAGRVGWDLQAKIDGQPVLLLEVRPCPLLCLVSPMNSGPNGISSPSLSRCVTRHH